MQVIEALWVSNYVRMLKANHKTADEIDILKKEFIDYLEGEKIDNLSAELKEFLAYLSENEKQEQDSKRKGR